MSNCTLELTRVCQAWYNKYMMTTTETTTQTIAAMITGPRAEGYAQDLAEAILNIAPSVELRKDRAMVGNGTSLELIAAGETLGWIEPSGSVVMKVDYSEYLASALRAHDITAEVSYRRDWKATCYAARVPNGGSRKADSAKTYGPYCSSCWKYHRGECE